MSKVFISIVAVSNETSANVNNVNNDLAYSSEAIKQVQVSALLITYM